MKHECSIVQDLLPLYAEGMVQKDTGEFIKDHLEKCESCRKALTRLEAPPDVKAPDLEAPLLHLRRKLMAKKIQTIVLTALLVSALLVSAFAFLDAPEFFPYSPELMTIGENPDQSLSITFDPAVTDYRCDSPSPGCYTIEAWTSQWDKWFTAPKVQTLTIPSHENLQVSYVSNNGKEDVCIYGQIPSEVSGMMTLPRLTLGYYAGLALISLLPLAILWAVLRRRPGARIWAERIMLYPVSYLLGHFMVLGCSTVSYSMTRDFCLILFISILVYPGLLLLHSLYYRKKELKALNG